MVSVESIRYYPPEWEVYHRLYTLKLRARYIIHYIKALPLHPPYPRIYIFMKVVRDIMKQIKLFQIDDMLDMIRNALMQHRDARDFELPLDLLIYYLV